MVSRCRQKMALSKEISYSLKQAMEVHNLVLKLDSQGTYKNTIRNGFFHAFCDMVIEHFGAIIVLVREEQYYGSALALLRPLVEAGLRALWLIHVADDDSIERIAKGSGKFPNLSPIYTAVEKSLKNLTKSEKVLFIDQNVIAFMNDLTHGGREQLSRRFDDKLRVKPSYSDRDIISLLDQAMAFTVTTGLERIQRVEGSEHILSPNTESLLNSYKKIRNHTL